MQDISYTSKLAHAEDGRPLALDIQGTCPAALNGRPGQAQLGPDFFVPHFEKIEQQNTPLANVVLTEGQKCKPSAIREVAA